MATYAKTFPSETAAIGAAFDEANFSSSLTIVPKTTATSALTAAEMVGGIIRQSGANGALSITTASAAAIVALIPNAQVGSMFEMMLMNTGDNTDTLVAGAGVTLVGTTAVPTNKSQIYRGVVTNATAGSEAVSLVGILFAPA